MPTKKRAPSRKPTKPTSASRKPAAAARSGAKARGAAATARKPAKAGATKGAAKTAAKPAKAGASKVTRSAAKRPLTKPAKPAKAAAKPAKAAAKPAKAAAKPAKAASRSPNASVQRRDHAGHLDPKYAADLRALGRAGSEDREGRGFVAKTHSTDALAENLGEMFVETVTTGEYDAEEVLGQDVPEDAGGPFIITRVKTELAPGTDKSNPRGAKREPFPTS